MIIRFKYQIIAYYAIIIAIVISAFLVYILQQSRDFSISAMRNSLIESNAEIYGKFKAGISFEEISATRKTRFTILDTNLNLIFHSEEGPVVIGDMGVGDEMMQAASKGDGTSLRFSATKQAEYLYYAKRYPEFYLRTSVPYKNEKVKLIHPTRGYQYAILVLIASLIITLFYISRRLTMPLKAFNDFFKMIKSNQKDFSQIEFPNNEYGEIGKKIADTYTQLEQAKQFKQEVTHNISHELKTPLTGIRAYLETILSDEQMDALLMRSFVQKAYKQTIRLSSLVNDVSMLNKLDEQAGYYKIEDINIASCLKEIEEELSFKMKENNTVFQPLISSELSIRSSHDIIYSLFKNLIDNTLEHGGENTLITIMAGISQISGEPGYRINFTYTDNGKGIPDEAIAKLFDRFYRIDKGRSRKSGGSGLGLAIVKNAVLFHKGDITVENAPEGGLVFKFNLMSL